MKIKVAMEQATLIDTRGDETSTNDTSDNGTSKFCCAI